MQIVKMNVSKSLEKVLEEAVVCGELRMVGRRLKDYPKMAYKFNLADTVFADLSKNRFTEMPEEVTVFPFLEKMLISHNVIRSIPESVCSLHSLQYLDIRWVQKCSQCICGTNGTEVKAFQNMTAWSSLH